MLNLIKLHDFTVKDFDHWFTIAQPKWGEINGLPMLRGKLIAHNGSLGLLLVHNKAILVHASSFIPDVVEKSKPQPELQSNPYEDELSTR